VLTVGLTGGIGAGKSAVAERLVEHGAVLVDSDQLAREVVAPGTDGLVEVIAEFGDGVLAEDGTLDRAAVAAMVFADEDRRRRLEAIIHPRVRARSAELFSAAAHDAIVVNDVPLLVEVGLAPTYHLVLVVEAAEPARVERLVRTRGMAQEQALARIRAQVSDTARRAAADVLLANDGTLVDLWATVDTLWRDRLVPFEENVRSRRPVRRPEKVHLAPYDQTWPQQYQRLAARLGHVAGDAAHRIDHIGSTAVPDLPAKDVIDIQLVVADLSTADALAESLASGGFPPIAGDWHDSPKPSAPDPAVWRKRVHGSADPARVVHLHVRPADSPGWRLALLLRDWLRADAQARVEYAQLKQTLFHSGLTTTQYAEHKEPWFDAVWERAERWADRTAWRP
jgi:dephospho-CoA kinase